MQYFGFDRPSFGFKTIGFPANADPDAEMKELFAGGKQGILYSLLPVYLWQDAARTVPVTADGDPVRVIDDLSGNGNHAIAPSSAARPIYRTDGILHWLYFDGVDDGFKLSYQLGRYELWVSTLTYYVNASMWIVDGRPLVSNAGAFQRSGGLNEFGSGVSLIGSNFVDPFGVGKVTGLNIKADTKEVVLFSRFNSTEGLNCRFYGLVQIASTTNSAERDSINDYLAKKAGVTL